jgi:hypothetical protein
MVCGISGIHITIPLEYGKWELDGELPRVKCTLYNVLFDFLSRKKNNTSHTHLLSPQASALHIAA